MSASASAVLPDPERAGDQDAAIAEHDGAGMDVCRRSVLAFGRQGDGEARAPDLARLGAGNVLGGQRAAMRLDDLPADRQAEAGILAERLARRPVGVEALEDAVDVVGADARAVVVDGQDDVPCRRATARW